MMQLVNVELGKRVVQFPFPFVAARRVSTETRPRRKTSEFARTRSGRSEALDAVVWARSGPNLPVDGSVTSAELTISALRPISPPLPESLQTAPGERRRGDQRQVRRSPVAGRLGKFPGVLRRHRAGGAGTCLYLGWPYIAHLDALLARQARTSVSSTDRRYRLRRAAGRAGSAGSNPSFVPVIV